MADEKDPFETLVIEEDLDGFAALSARSVAGPNAAAPVPAAATARFHGFDLEERPLLSGVPGLPGEVVAARTTVPLLRDHRGAAVVVVFEDGDARRPLVLRVLRELCPHEPAAPAPQPRVSVQADEERLVLSAAREIVLRCGEASITLTRAGKVLIKGAYVLSRSSGYNRIKGAAVDIN